jgi:ornithine cyclodeaminase/alanine dehydrogenase
MEGTRPRYLDAAAVAAAMPPVDQRLALAERTLRALVDEADLPAKIGVHPRPSGSFAHAMPAALLPRDGADLLGIKWVTGFGENAARGLPAIGATVLLNDPATGRLRAILDGAGITAERTAAVSGVAIARFGPTAARLGGRGPRVGLVGAGVQGHSHLAVLGHVLPGASLAIFDRHADRAAALASAARATPGIAGADVAASARAAVADADVVVNAASFTTPDRRQAMTADWLRDDALVVAVDYATMLHADVARSAALFLVDERGQFVANRDAGQFDGYPDPAATLGEALRAGTGRPAGGRVVVSHLGVGLADVVFGDAILARALELGLGQELGAADGHA